MKILMVSPYLPWPLYGGASVRIFNLIKELSNKGHKIILLAGKQNNSDALNDPLNKLCEQVHLYELPKQGRFLSILRSVFSLSPYPSAQFKNRRLKENFNELIEKNQPDLIWINFLFLAEILSRISLNKIPVVLDQFEADELVWQRYIKEGNFIQKLFSYFNLKKIQRLQKKVFERINALLCVSEKEANFMKPKVPSKTNILVVPNGVDIDFFTPELFLEKLEPIILVAGSMCVLRNINSAIWFAKSIFPKIKKDIHDAEFWIVGFNPDKKVLTLGKTPGVRVIGTVDDMRLYYKKAKAYVAPFKFGEGTRLKILEAMASGIPIVSTKEGCQGIDIIDGKHVIIADNENDFANKVVELLNNNQLAKKLSKNAREFIEQKYSWSKIIDDLDKKILQIIQNNE